MKEKERWTLWKKKNSKKDERERWMGKKELEKDPIKVVKQDCLNSLDIQSQFSVFPHLLQAWFCTNQTRLPKPWQSKRE